MSDKPKVRVTKAILKARLAEAAARALKEAEERRRKPTQDQPAERGGQDGPEPTRYGDWEKKGLISDF